MNAMFLLGMPGGSEMLIVFLVVLLLFGGTRLPKLAKGLGESMKEFKKGVAMGDSDDEVENSSRRRLKLRAAETSGLGAGEIVSDHNTVGEWR
jgi:sec-independent protein translocase protein TatA